MSKHDVIIIGGGLSGLAAGIRLSQVGMDVQIFERHRIAGGLNSYYVRGDRIYDTGLHALTNISRPGVRTAPLNVLLRQLRLRRDDWEICEQKRSSVYFPGMSLTFTNDSSVLLAQVARCFPQEADRFRDFHELMCSYDPFFFDRHFISAKEVLEERIHDALLRDMISCPVMYYGNACEGDMDLRQFCIIYRSIFVEGMGRPAGGMQRIIHLLEQRLAKAGAELRLGCGIHDVEHDGTRVTGVVDDRGERHEARLYLSCAGGPETARLLTSPVPGLSDLAPGEMSYVEMLFDLDCEPPALGFQDGIEFRQLKGSFDYRQPSGSLSKDGYVVCAPANFAGIASNELRVTALSSHRFWAACDAQAYGEEKLRCQEQALEWLERVHPGIRDHVVAREMYTPRTFTRFTGRLHGAIYGIGDKQWDGSTSLANLVLCGADQGYLGIVGALLSGVTMANLRMIELVK